MKSIAFKCFVFACAVLGFATLVASAQPQSPSAQDIAQITFDQHLNTQVAGDLGFTDERGKPVHLRDYFGRRPTILLLGYYGCPMLCSLTLNGMVAALQDLKWTAGTEFDVIYVSIDPHETTALGSAKKENYLRRYGRPGEADGWHFLTGEEQTIRKLVDEVGFRYVYDPVSKEYAHPSGLVVLTPDGRISRYLFGVTFDSQELLQALRGASERKISSPIQRLVLLCFHYNPITGKYSGLIMGTVRALAVLTLFGLIAIVWITIRRKSSTRSLKASADRQTPAAAPPL